ncbi:hypothetical protein SAMN04490239_5690 [Rhodococcus koreensis]|uniref:Uncharacterized protein n=1 Tax=Rhodococcus koreensis TaxID=99653 RepID=A0A1H4VUJ2_9NOCA|nr:hypothetical protein SAMN04490239_5690 [Rhodococcus koreensis]
MARRAVFDPTDRDLFNEQRQRFDWSLLQNGAVFRYDTRFQLDSACDRLTGLGYLICTPVCQGRRVRRRPGPSSWAPPLWARSIWVVASVSVSTRGQL